MMLLCFEEGWREYASFRLQAKLCWMQKSMFVVDNIDRTVVVAMIIMRVVESSVDNVVDVVSVRYGFMTAVFPVLVFFAIIDGLATRGIGGGHVKRMFVVMITMRVVQVPVVHVVDMV